MSYQSVTFGVNNEIVNTDLESHIRPATALSDGQKANVGITINQSDFTRELCWNLGDGVNQAADISWLATSTPSRNVTPRTSFGN
jgi:hypothetical protein